MNYTIQTLSTPSHQNRKRKQPRHIKASNFIELESLFVTQSFFNVAFRHVKSLQNDPVIF